MSRSTIKNGSGSRFGTVAKFLTVFIPMVTALVMAVVALKETNSKAPEEASKAAHNELVSKLKALDKDLSALEKRISKRVYIIRQELRLDVATAKAQSDSVRALFTGYALASRGKSSEKTVIEVEKIIKESQERTKKIVKSKAEKQVIKSLERVFKKPKSWNQIQQQVQKPVN